MAQVASVSTHPPLSEINTTPLIDVLLVLLILLVITVPPATHSLDIPLPPPPSEPAGPINPLRNTLTIDPRGKLGWNGAATSERELFALLGASARLKPEPELRFLPDGRAPYGKSLRVLNLIKTSGVTAFGFAGIEQHGSFDRAD